MTHRIVMLTTSYPRFEGDIVGTFMSPIAHGIAARGHEVHIVAPWHPLLTRGAVEGGVRFHFYRYALHPSLHVFGYATGLKADVALKPAAWMAAPLALAAGWRLARSVATRVDATVVHGHWVIPGGATADAARGARPLVVSLHGSDVFVAEKHPWIGRVARRVFGHADYVTACSADLATRALALGAPTDRTEVVPYGVDTTRFAPSADARRVVRARLGIADTSPLVFAVGRFVKKKGFEYLIDATARLRHDFPDIRTVIAGAGDLTDAFTAQVDALGLSTHIVFPGQVAHGDVAGWCAAADVIAVPSIRDDAGNVDGLPNVVLEALASATVVVSTRAGGIGQVIAHDQNGCLVPERDADALATAIGSLLQDPARRQALGRAARAHVERHHGWAHVAERFEAAYDMAVSRRR